MVPLERLRHVERRKRRKHRQRDHLLHDLVQPHVELRVAEAVGRDLQKVVREGDAPLREVGRSLTAPDQAKVMNTLLASRTKVACKEIGKDWSAVIGLLQSVKA